jgi:hypothetical protein
MTRLIEILISLAIVAVLFLAVGVVLPSSRHISESVETNRKLTIVYDTLNSFKRFKAWNVLALRDPRMDIKLSGPDAGVGARLDYVSNQKSLGVGSGSWEITASEPKKRVAVAIENNERGNNKRSEFILKPTGRSGRNVEITQTYDVDYGWNLIGRYGGLYVSRHVGDGMQLSLSRLSNMLASVPNVDYAVKGSKLAGLKVVERPAEHLLVVSAGSIERNNEKIKASMKGNMEWIKRTMDASGLVAAGPMRIVSTELGSETYTFDIVQPVLKGSGASKDSDDDSEDADTDTAATTPAPAAVATDETPLSVKLQGPVTYVQTKPTRTATGSYTGFMAELDNVRNAVRAWALTQGYEVVDRPYEVYKNGIDPAFTEGGLYDVYWTLK